MPPKPKPKSEQRYWFATHRVNANGDWQANIWDDETGEREWVPVDYDDVPDQLWSKRFSRDGWKFYTDRTRECNERGFPVNREG
jgi:hypothetical protein